jgi:hypothetical protein
MTGDAGVGRGGGGVKLFDGEKSWSSESFRTLCLRVSTNSCIGFKKVLLDKLKRICSCKREEATSWVKEHTKISTLILISIFTVLSTIKYAFHLLQ